MELISGLSAYVARPLWLWALPLSLAFVLGSEYLLHRSKPDTALFPRAQRPFLLLRMLALLAVSAALAGVGSHSASSSPHTLYLLDRSLSMERFADRHEQLLQFLSRPDGQRRKGSLISFAAAPGVEYTRLPERGSVELHAEHDRSATDISAALATALGNLPPDSAARIVLISDGLETSGRALETAQQLADHSIPVSVLPPGSAGGLHDVALRRLRLPPQVDRGRSITMTAEIVAGRPFRGSIEFYKNDAYLGERNVDLPAGESYLGFTDVASDEGLQRYRAVLRAADDIFPRNDIAAGSLYVAGPGRLLYISKAPDESSPAVRALRAQGFSVQLRSPEELPRSAEEYRSIRAVILDNVPATALSMQSMRRLEQFVRLAGGGLVMIGGEESFGPGGYYKTPIERLLPVDMDISSEMSSPALSMVMLVDKSASMGGGTYYGKLEIVKQAVLSATEMLNPYYSVGILSFDADAEWIVPMVRAGNSERITRDLARLSPGGGTKLLPAMHEARRKLRDDPAEVRHLLVLSDGLVDPADYAELAAAMHRDGITVSTVAVGEEADTELMGAIAARGGGRAYRASRLADAPRIFASEAMVVSRKLITEESYLPEIVADHPVVGGIGDLPPFEGCVLTYTKDEALQVITALENYPLLSVRNYGFGRSAAFTADLAGRWSAPLLRSPAFPKLIGQVLRWVENPGSEAGIFTRLEYDSPGQARLICELRNGDGSYRNGLSLTAALLQEQLRLSEVVLRQTAPGRYEGRLRAETPGPALLTIADRDRKLLYREATVVPPPAELLPPADGGAAGERLLQELVALTGGRLLTGLDPERIDRLPASPRPGTAGPSAAEPLLLAALLLFLAEILWHSLRLFRRSRSALTRGGRNRDAGAEPPSPLEEVRRRKREAEAHEYSFWFGGRSSGGNAD